MKKYLLALLFGSALVLAACGGGDDAGDDTGNNEDTGTETEQNDDGATGNEDTGTDEGAEDGGTVDVAAAEKIYQNNCSMCHGADLSGGAGPDLTAVGSSYSQAEIQDIILNGKGGMMPINISEDDASTVAAWLADKK